MVDIKWIGSDGYGVGYLEAHGNWGVPDKLPE